jgi:hypothetical protein
MAASNAVVEIYNSDTEAEASIKETPEVGVRHEETVHCRQGLSPRVTRCRLLLD